MGSYINATAFNFYFLTEIPISERYSLRSGIAISPKWKRDAARTASAFPSVKGPAGNYESRAENSAEDD